MKRIKYYLIICLVLVAYSCEVSYNDDFIDPSKPYGTAMDIDPGFEFSSLVDVTQIAIYTSYEHTVNYKRTYGISRELEVEMKVDETALNNYNTLFDLNYKLLPAEYYDMPSQVEFKEKDSQVELNVTFYPEKLVKNVGLEEASRYVLPISAIPVTQTGVAADSASNTTLLRVHMLEPVVTVTVPNAVTNLDFIMDSGFDESVTMTGELNFTGFESAEVTFTATQEDVDAYNAANGTNYKLLPANNYGFDEMSVDSKNMLTIQGKINADGLDDSFQYLLPCYVSSSKYVIEQVNPIYFTVNITELYVSIADANNPVANYSYNLETTTGNIVVNLNGMVSDDISINFTYDPSLVAAYNTANGTSFLTMDAGKITINNTQIVGGQKSINVPYSIAVNGLGVEDHYLLPFVLQENDLELGSVSGPKVIYIDYTKSLIGDYNLNKIATSRGRNVVDYILPASKCPRTDGQWPTLKQQAQYMLGADGEWYSILFKVTDTDMDGMTGCKKIEIYTFLENIETYGGSNKVSDNQSYYNTLTGEVRIDFLGFESWNSLEGRETYSLTIPE